MPRHGGRGAIFDHERARQDKRGDLCIAEAPQQTPHVAINGLGPDILARIKVAANQHGIDSCVDGCGIECNQAALGITDDAYPCRFISFLEPIDCRKHFLHLVAYDVSAHLERLAINPFAIRLIGSFEPGVIRIELGPAHQCRDDKLKPVLSQAAGELLLRLDARRQPE